MTGRVAGWALVMCAAVFAGDTAPGDGLGEPVRLEADGKPIDLKESLGHAGPLVVDWDGDGRQDLLVGQFSEGKLRIHLNTGDGAPVLGAPSWFEAGGKIGTVPTG